MISRQRFVDWKFLSYRERYEEFHIAYLALINPTSFRLTRIPDLYEPHGHVACGANGMRLACRRAEALAARKCSAGGARISTNDYPEFEVEHTFRRQPDISACDAQKSVANCPLTACASQCG